MLCEVYDYSKYIAENKQRFKDLCVIVATDPLKATVFEPPGSYNADIVVGSMQRFGLPMWNGGPPQVFSPVRRSICEICLEE